MGVVANVLGCDIVVSEFEFQLCYFFIFVLITLTMLLTPLHPNDDG